LECDSFVRRDFFYCQTCAEPTDLGKSKELKIKAAEQSMAFKTKKKRDELNEDWILGKVKIPEEIHKEPSEEEKDKETNELEREQRANVDSSAVDPDKS